MTFHFLRSLASTNISAVLLPSQAAIPSCIFIRCLGNENIKHIDCIDYLGVKSDAHLPWNDQIDAVCKKLAFIISRLSRLRHVLAPRILMYQGII